MPRVMGVNLVGVLAGAVTMYFIGFVIYGLLFQEVWTQQMLMNHGVLSPEEASSVTGEALTARLGEVPQVMDQGLAMGLGFLVSLVTSAGIAIGLKLLKPSAMGTALGFAVLFWLAFAMTTASYNVIYYSESVINFGLDAVHMLLGYLAAAAVIFLIDGKAIRGEG